MKRVNKHVYSLGPDKARPSNLTKAQQMAQQMQGMFKGFFK